MDSLNNADGPRPKLQFALQNPGQFSPLPRISQLKAWIQATLSPSFSVAEITLRLVDATEIRQLNHQYRGQDKATNILSLTYENEENRLLGDLAVCGEILQQEATAQGKPYLSHFAHLMIHGTLHLQGEDHELPEAARRMEQKEITILSQFAIPNPYEEVL